MPTSGTTNWSLNRDQVITTALRKLGVLPSGFVADGNKLTDAVDSLNALVKTLQADGMPLWKLSSQTFTTVADTATYTVGPAQTVSCPKPLKVLQAFATTSDGIKIPLQIYTSYDYNELTTAPSTGTPLTLFYLPGSTTGTIKLWPTPEDSTTTIEFHYTSPFEDMTGGTNEFDFPSYWITPLIYMLAWMMAPEYGVPPNDRVQLAKEAEYWHQYALSMGSEEGSIKFRPERR